MDQVEPGVYKLHPSRADILQLLDVTLLQHAWVK